MNKAMHYLLAGASLLTAFGVANTASAADATGAAAAAGPQLEEVVVTAQRRSETLINVPASVEVVTPQRLGNANIVSGLDLTKVSPGVSLDPRGAFVEPTIRGVTTEVTSIGNAANVAVYLDGIYQASQRGNFFQLNAIDQIQILKGPQGTLYGRNATGGAILISTKNPTFTPAADLSTSYGSLGDIQLNGYVTGGLGDKVAANLAVQYHRDDGYITNVTTGHLLRDYNDLTIRGKLLFRPIDNFTYVLSADYEKLSEPADLVSPLLNGNSSAKQTAGVVLPTGIYQADQSFDAIMDTYSDGVTGRGDWALPGATLTSLTGYRFVRGHSRADTDAGPLPVSSLDWVQIENSISQEFDIASTWDKPINYTAGALYTVEEARYNPYYSNGVLQAITHTVTTSYSFFGELTYRLTDRLAITGGLRYTNEAIVLSGSSRYIDALAPIYSDPPGTVEPALLYNNGHLNYGTTTPRVTVKYNITDNTNAYFSFNQGFKSGGFNTSVLGGSTKDINGNKLVTVPPFNPETITAYEIGLKSHPTSQLSLETAVYYEDYRNIQVSSSVPSLPGVAFSGNLIYNAAGAHIYGLDLDGVYQATSDLKLNAGLNINHARYSSFPNALVTTPWTNGPFYIMFVNKANGVVIPGTAPSGTPPAGVTYTQIVGCTAKGTSAPCGNAQYLTSATGKSLVRAPDATANVGFDYKHDFDVGRFDAAGNLYYSSGFYADFANRLQQKAYAVLDGSIGFSPKGSGWRISIWAKNLTNTIYAYGFIDSSIYDSVKWAEPRTFGVALNAHF